MKRRDIIAKLEKAGFEMVEGGRHTHVTRDGKFVSVIGRHREVAEQVVRSIERQTGVSLR